MARRATICFLFPTAVALVHQFVKRARDGTFSTRSLYPIAEFCSKLSQVFQFRGVGLVVDTVDEGLRLLSFLFSSPNRLGNSPVGQQHEFLNQFVGILRFLVVAACGLALFVDVEMQFLAVELHGAVVEATLAQLLGQGVEDDDFACKLALVFLLVGCGFARAVLHAVLLQYFLHFLVGKTAVALDDGMHQPPVLDVGFAVELEDHAVA